MILLLHIIIALTSIVFSTMLFVAPSKKKIALSYGFIGLTISSGVTLMITSPSTILHLCFMGLLYTLGTLYVVRLASLKLHTQSANS